MQPVGSPKKGLAVVISTESAERACRFGGYRLDHMA
jgi:hypothetical protein